MPSQRFSFLRAPVSFDVPDREDRAGETMKNAVIDDLRNISNAERRWAEFLQVSPRRATTFDSKPLDLPLKEFVKARFNPVEAPKPHLPGSNGVPPASISAPRKPARLSVIITNPGAAKKVKEFMDARGLTQTEFALQSNTSDKTIRKFFRTGQIKRSLVAGIASAMGITREELLAK